MMNMNSHRFARAAGITLLAGSLAFAACDDVTDELLEVRDPDTVNPTTLNDPATLQLQVNGAIQEFTAAYSGGESVISTSALMSDEFFSSGTFTTRTATDRRDQFDPQNGNTTDGSYNNLQTARRATREAADAVAEFASTADPRWAQMKTLEAMSHVALAENYCPAIPLSTGNSITGEIDFAAPSSGSAVFNVAVGLADQAIGAGGGSFPAVVKGRALLNLGQFAAAAAAVSAVPTEFVAFTFHSTSGISNGIFALQDNGRYSNGDGGLYGGANGLPYRTDGFAPAAPVSLMSNPTGDIRIPWWQDPDDPGGFDDNFPLFKSLRYVDFFSPIAIASGVEARLIEAEAALNAGDVSGMLDILNDLRDDASNLMNILTDGIVDLPSSLSDLSDPGTLDARVDMLMKERAYWMHITGHRMGDLRRLVNQYGRAIESTYPTGTYFKGGSYGSDVNFFLSFREETNNPNIPSINAICNVGNASF